MPAEVPSEECVVYSGDLVTTDEDGFIYYIGRRDTMIKSSGYRISPSAICAHRILRIVVAGKIVA